MQDSNFNPNVTPLLNVEGAENLGFTTTPSVFVSDFGLPVDYKEFEEIPTFQAQTDPQTKATNSQKELDSQINKVKQSLKLSFRDYGKVSESIQDKYREFAPKESAIKYDVNIDEIYDTLSTGKSIYKYGDNPYRHGIDNEEFYAQRQGTGEKWLHGAEKFGIKTLSYAAAGIASMIYSPIQAIKEGSFSAFYDNDLSRWMNDNDMKMNYKLPNYMTKAEKDMNFFQKLGTANFWANDVLSGASYTVAALGTEAIMAYVTGGTSLVGAAGRAAMRATTKAGIKAGAGAGLRGLFASTRGYLADVKMGMNAYLRTMKPATMAAETLHNARFMYTSAGWEANVEAYGYLKDARRNFIESYKNAHGKMPDSNEIAQFEDQATGIGNSIFAANVGIVGLSNMVMFGKIFGVGAGVGDKLTKATNRMFGIGTVKSIENGKVVWKALDPSRFQKVAKITTNILEKPLSEGIWEEGMQGVVSKAGDSYIQSRFDPNAVDKNISFSESIKKGFVDTYGTKEGWNEIGIGMIIGGFGGGNPLKGNVFGLREYSMQKAELNSQINELNKSTEGISESLRKQIEFAAPIERAKRMNVTNAASLDKFQGLSSAISNTDLSEQSSKNDDFTASTNAFNTSMFSHLESSDKMGMMDDAIDNFNYIIDNTDIASIKNQLGLSDSEARQYKEASKLDFKSKADSYKRAKKFADMVVGGDNDFSSTRSVLALNAFLAESSLENMNGLADSIQQITGIGGLVDGMGHYVNLNKQQRDNIQKINDIQDEIDSLGREVGQLNYQTQGVDKEVVSKASEKRNQLDERLVKLNAEKQQLESTLSTSVSSFDYNPRAVKLDGTKGIVTVAQLLDANRELRHVDSLVKSMKETNPVEGKMLESLTGEYRQQLLNYRAYGDTMRRMQDPKFLHETQKGITSLIKSFSTKYEEYENQLDKDLIGIEDPANQALNLYARDRNKTDLKEAFDDGIINEDEYYTALTYNNMLSIYQRQGSITDITSKSQVETVDDIIDVLADDIDVNSEDYLLQPLDSTFERIAQKNHNKSDLTPREKKIYDKFNKRIDEKQQAFKINQGDSPLSVLNKIKDRLNSLSKDRNIIQRYTDAINQFLEDNEKIIKDKGLPDSTIINKNDINRFKELYPKYENDTIKESELDEFADLSKKIEDAGRETGFLNVIPILQDLTIQENVKGNIGDLTDIDTTNEVLNETRSESVNTANMFNMMQNPGETVQANNENGTLNISNISIDNFFNQLGISDYKDKGKPLTINGDQVIEYSISINGSDVKIIHSSYRNRILINEDYIKILDSAGIVIKNIEDTSSPWATVYKRQSDGEVTKLIPLRTDSGYGKNGVDRIDQDAALNTKPDDPILLQVDIEDSYNQDLINDYKNAVESKDASKISSARERLVNGLVIKGMNMKGSEVDGNFVSVLPSVHNILDRIESASLDQLLKIRQYFTDRLIASDFSSNIKMEDSVGNQLTIPVKYVFSDKPTISVTESGNEIIRDLFDFTEESGNIDKVQDVGYILNGKLVFHGATEADGVNKQFVKSIISQSKSDKSQFFGIKKPIVVFTRNGIKYAYPVDLKKSGNQKAIDMLKLVDAALENPSNVEYNEIPTIINNFLSKSKVNRNEYTVEPISDKEAFISSLEKVKGKLEEMSIYPNIADWANMDKSEILSKDLAIDIDLRRPFHSPKIQVSYASAVESIDSTPKRIVDESKIDSDDIIPEFVSRDVNDELNKPC